MAGDRGFEFISRQRRVTNEPSRCQARLCIEPGWVGAQYFRKDSHNAWGTDHFGFLYRGDLDAFCAELRGKGASFPVELKPASAVAAFVTFAAPDGVSMRAVPEQVPRCGQADIQGFDIPPLAGLPSS